MAARSRTSKGRVPAPDPTPMRRALHAWYRSAKRDLPWRRTRDPYAIWVSEIMLQQTRVEVVAPYYGRFLRRFPDVAALARAPLEDVLHTWAGLGYYRRARHLHAAAQRLVADHDGCVPEAPGALEALPGIGRYTAGAIRSIAFGEPAPILDGNVTRVFARVYGLDAPVESAAMRAHLWELAATWAAGDSPSETNQGLMELGATVCTAIAPACVRCPLTSTCDARRTDRTATLPRPRVRPPVRRVAMVVAIVRRRGRILLVQRRSGALLQAFWELPACTSRPTALAARILERLHVQIGPTRDVGRVRHTILSNAIDAQIVAADTVKVSRTPRSRALPTRSRRASTPIYRATRLANLDLPELAMKWVRREELALLPLTTLAHKALARAQH